MTRAEFLEAAAIFCDLTGGSVTSWKRTLKHNAVVGGVTNSAHLYGLAVDVVYDALPEPPLPATMERARRLGLKLIREGDHDHLQPATWEAG